MADALVTLNLYQRADAFCEKFCGISPELSAEYNESLQQKTLQRQIEEKGSRSIGSSDNSHKGNNDDDDDNDTFSDSSGATAFDSYSERDVVAAALIKDRERVKRLISKADTKALQRHLQRWLDEIPTKEQLKSGKYQYSDDTVATGNSNELMYPLDEPPPPSSATSMSSASTFGRSRDVPRSKSQGKKAKGSSRWSFLRRKRGTKSFEETKTTSESQRIDQPEYDDWW